MSRLAILAFTSVAFGLSTIAHAGIVIPANLHPGDHFHLAFVTSGTRDATSSSIADYNQFVQAQAALDPALTGTAMGVQWRAIASTTTTTALANLSLLPNVPIYLLDGSTKVSVTDATGWPGTPLLHSIDFDQFATDVSSGGMSFAWTGTGASGTGAPGITPLGGAGTAPELGAISGFLDSRWVAFGQAFSQQALPLYAVSSALILVPGDVNLDGLVNGLDISLVASHWLQTGAGAPGDANEDGIVNGLDISLIASHWLQTSTAGGGGAQSAAVPEPSAVALIALGGILAWACAATGGHARGRGTPAVAVPPAGVARPGDLARRLHALEGTNESR